MEEGEIKAFSGKVWEYLQLIDETKGTIKRCTLVRKKSNKKRNKEMQRVVEKKNDEQEY